MINHEYLELFNQSSIKKDIDIAYDDSHITNDDVVSGSFSLNESAFATKELRFGSLVSSQMSVKLFNTIPSLIDKELDVSMVVDNIVSNPLKIGKFKVLEDKPTTDRLYKQIKAYDALYEVINKNVVDWYESLSFPLEQKAFRDSFFNYIGITQVDITLVNDDMLIERTITANTISGQQVLSAICELNGAIGRMNRDGNFEYVILEVNPADRITIDKIQSKSGSYEDFDCQPISKVQIRQTTDDIGAIVGTDGNTYIMQDNFLVYGKSSTDLTTIATNLLSVIEGISYTPFNIKAIYGNPCYEIGDAITVVTRNKTFNSYIFNRTLKGIQAINDTIKADGVEYYTENLNSANVQMQQLKRQTNELSRTVEETKSTITSIEMVAETANNNAQTALDNVGEAYDKATEALDTVGSFDERITKNESSITQNAKEIELKVSSDEIISTINQSAEEVRIQADKIKLEGTVTANKTFKILDNGSVQITGGYINIITDDENASNISLSHTSSDGKHITESRMQPNNFTTESKDYEYVESGEKYIYVESALVPGYIFTGYEKHYTNGTYEQRGVHITPMLNSIHSATSFADESSKEYWRLNREYIRTAGELQSTYANGFRMVQGKYGFLIRNDGSNIYFMLTASGDQYGNFNSLRPLYINTSNGAVGMGNGLTVNNGIASNNNLTVKGNTNVARLDSSSTIHINGVSYLNGGVQVNSNGTAIKLIKSGTTVVTPGNTTSTSVKLFAQSTVLGWYSGATANNMVVLLCNGDGIANGVHIESATYQSSDSSWYAVCNSAVAKAVRINYTVICW